MPITHSYHQETKTVEMLATGVVTTSELLAYVKSIVADKNVEPGFIEVADFEPVEDLVLKYTEVEPFKDLWKEYLQKGCRATVIHAPSDMAYGTLRMAQTVIGLSREDAAGRFIVVRSREELESVLENLYTRDRKELDERSRQ